MELTHYTDAQLELLFKHDIDYDENLSEHVKPLMRDNFMKIFKETSNVVVQFLVAGPYAISKM